MSRLKVFAAICVLTAQVTAALAADMPKGYPRETLPPLDMPKFRSHDANSGWYLRGDLGYYWGRIGSAQSDALFPNPVTNSLGNGMTGALGVGIKREWIRTDLTADYHSEMKYTGAIAAPGDVTAKVSAMSVLLNGYLDLGSWYRVSPYLGVGIGAYACASPATRARRRRRSPPASRTRNGISPGRAWPALATSSRPTSSPISATATSISATSRVAPMPPAS